MRTADARRLCVCSDPGGASGAGVLLPDARPEPLPLGGSISLQES